MCDQCSSKFRHPYLLREHVDAVHLKKKPFKCGVGDCNWVTGYHASVGVHKRKVHGFTPQKPGRPRSEKIKEDKEIPEDNDCEDPKLEFKKTLIEEVKKRPQIWDTAHHHQGYTQSKKPCEEDWIDICNNLERTFANKAFYHNMFASSSKKASIEKMKSMWWRMAQKYTRLEKSFTVDTNCRDDNQVADWPFYASLKFLKVASCESSKEPNEPQIFKDVRKYVQQRCNEGEKGATNGINGGL